MSADGRMICGVAHLRLAESGDCAFEFAEGVKSSGVFKPAAEKSIFDITRLPQFLERLIP